MDNLESAKNLLAKINMPTKQQGALCCLTLLAMAKLKNGMPWNEATNDWIRIHDVIAFIAENYGVMYAENSRETFRKQAMHPFRTAALIEDNGKATNSPNYRYRITPEFLAVIQSLQGKGNCVCKDSSELAMFLYRHDTLSNLYASKKKMQKMPVRINSLEFTFSPGKHNQLQKAIIEEFAPRFAPNSECLYVGDTIQKDMVKNVEKLSSLGFEITLHDKMPDVVLYREDKNWIYFIESVTSVGPMDPKRILEIESMTKKVAAGKIYVTAFIDFVTFKKFSEQLAWETEVWISDMPDHMIHLNGDKFLGPR
ncbi:bsuBI/PstI restriction endonuclease family protein [Bacteroides fragilis str. S38L5]|uniref:BsuBI/PstI family type II restriction endonuclease n=1 Tax=Bacteroides fragilis TaxID=817 RepID=UPI0004505709|nr:BsuBI/PstI family type II restriction endonuclease [Bacteroides fragilis]EYA95106.1 bsuBI/PstI restriction endonuclease family protein [Bacteroides fragilis str. S38L5]EYB13902.1 bsuBI/PstI restriction endonuclease family protein [Bacteroides fragilis str. S38L3]MCE9296265.1 restriction endonuclease [Bacteroides fragilis]MCE9312983.1 restriction endonuclease [Bacteroides fragilis]MCS3292638.1 restriction endonuclease [Bacteroides fragilis]